MENLPLALNLTFVGMSVVFIALILLSLIISASSKLMAMNKGVGTGKDTAADEASVLEIEEDEEAVPDSPISEKPDEELAAVIMAAIMAGMTPESQCKLRIKSFRRIEQTSPAWNKAGRLEQIAGRL